MTLDEAIKDCLETVSQNEEEAEAYFYLQKVTRTHLKSKQQ